MFKELSIFCLFLFLKQFQQQDLPKSHHKMNYNTVKLGVEVADINSALYLQNVG